MRPRLRVTAGLLLAGVFVQLGLGALVAGLRAGLIYNSWPLMGTSLVPPVSELTAKTPLWRNIFENPTTAQLDHRLMAYLLLAVALLHAIDVWRTAPGRWAALTATLVLVAVALQASIGIMTLLWAVPLGAALAHQAMAMLVLVAVVTHRCGLRRRRGGRLADPGAEVIGFGFLSPAGSR